MHPLSDIPLVEAFPLLCCCLRPCSGSRKEKDSQKLRDEVAMINKRLNNVIEKAEGEKYQGTNFSRDLSKKFGVAWVKKDGQEVKKKEKVQS